MSRICSVSAYFSRSWKSSQRKLVQATAMFIRHKKSRNHLQLFSLSSSIIFMSGIGPRTAWNFDVSNLQSFPMWNSSERYSSLQIIPNFCNKEYFHLNFLFNWPKLPRIEFRGHIFLDKTVHFTGEILNLFKNFLSIPNCCSRIVPNISRNSPISDFRPVLLIFCRDHSSPAYVVLLLLPGM